MTNTALGLHTALASRGMDVKTIVKALALQSDDAVYVTGSVVDGFGDAQSDLDIYVVCDRSSLEARRDTFDSERVVQQIQHDFGIAYIDVGGAKLDVEFHPRDKFDSLLADLDDLRPVTREKLWKSFRSLGSFERPYALELLHRLRCSWPLDNLRAYEQLRSRLDEATFLDWNILFALMECEDFAKGVRRSLHEGDAQSACLKLRHFYDSLTDAILFSAGESLDRWKWRLPKLRRIGEDQGLLRDYLEVQFNSPHFEVSSLAGFVEAMLAKGLARHSVVSRRFQ